MFARADSYQTFMGRWSQRLAPELVRFSEVRDGHYVLDVGCGTGALTAALRDAFATVRVVGVDASENFVQHATAEVADARARFEVGDAQHLKFSDATFDAAVSSLVLNFVPDPGRAIREMMRVTKPDGIWSAVVWDHGKDGMQMLSVFWEEAIAIDPAAKARDEANMTLCREGALAELCHQQGLKDVQASSLEVPLEFASFDDYWSPFSLGIGPAGAYFVSLPHDQRNLLRDRLQKRLATSQSSIELSARAWAVRATNPA
jgi:SAM-dependent methyltransferase